jgi:hypothetical protein
MNLRRLSNYPELIHEDGLRRLWQAVIRQAVEDLNNGGHPIKGGESPNVKRGRQLDAYHWLFSERSDLAFQVMGVDAEAFREEIRARLPKLGLEMPTEPAVNIKLAA